MRVLICAGMAPFGSAMKQIVQKQTGAGHNLFGVDLNGSDTGAVMEYQNQLNGALMQAKSSGEPVQVIVMLDWISSPAYEQIGMWAAKIENPVLLLAGASVPMILDAWYMKDDVDNLYELKQSLMAQGRQNVYGSLLHNS